MQVIKGGSPQRWTQEVTCTGRGNAKPGCRAVLLLEEGDLFHTYSHHYDGSTEKYTTFECPECHVFTDVPQSKVPGYVVIYKDYDEYKKAQP